MLLAENFELGLIFLEVKVGLLVICNIGFVDCMTVLTTFIVHVDC